MNPDISVIIPVYNTEKFLPACLDSLCSQTMQEIEFLCVNDGSTDSSGEILAQFAEKDPRFRVFNQKNAGSASARNKGLAEARGKYIMFCDSDDWYEPNMCERMHQIIENQNVDFVMCNTFVEQIDRARNVPHEHLFPNFGGKKSFSGKILSKLNVLLWNKIFRKNLIDHYGISFPAGMHGIDDFPFSLSYFFVSKHAWFLDEKLYHYVQRTGSFVDDWEKNTNLKNFISILGMLKKLYHFLDQKNLLQKKGILFLQYYFNFIRVSWSMIPSAHYSEILNRIRTDVSQFQIKYRSFSPPCQFFSALLAEDYRTMFRILYHIPSDYAFFFRRAKYAFLEKMMFGKKKKFYRRKKIRVLYEYRCMERAIACFFRTGK